MLNNFEECISVDNTCSFYDFNEFKSSVETIDGNNFSVLNLNIRSLATHYDELLIFLNRLLHKFSIIILTETWLTTSNQNDYLIPGYKSKHIMRQDRKGGGVSIYYKEDYTCNIIQSGIDELLEFIFLQINCPGFKKPLVVGGIYRPPGFNRFNDVLCKFEEILNHKSMKNKNIIFGGDLNVNLLNYAENRCKEFVDLMLSNGMYPLITKPTRLSPNYNHITINSRTGIRCSLLDHLWTNVPTVSKSGVVRVNITDHFPVFSHFSYGNSRNFVKVLTFRDMSLPNKKRFINEITLVNWNDVVSYTTSSVDENTNSVVKVLENIYNECFPIKRKQYSSKRIENPWVTEGILNSIDRSHFYYKQCCLGLISKEFYQRFKNRLTSLIRTSKRNYFKYKFDICSNDIKSTWKNINVLLNKGTCERPIRFELNGEIFSDSTVISNAFCNYFKSVPLDVVDNLKSTNANFYDYLTDSNLCSMFVSPITSDEICSTINSIKSKSSNINSIPCSIFKLISSHISPVLAGLFNMSIEQGIFPEKFKEARVIPLFKSGKVEDMKNYRPISILPFLAKLFEKIMHSRILKFLNKNKIISSNQYGFQPKRGTTEALINLTNEVNDSFNDRQNMIATFIDFQKAFDTVSHDILLHKLYHYGFRGSLFNWFKSYLSNRSMYVDFNDSLSSKVYTNIGVPQGSVLGPLLFLIYINDISNSTKFLNFILFADDTTIYFRDSDLNTCFNVFNRELINLDDWTKANKISINYSKTKSMIFSPNDLGLEPNGLFIKFGINKIEQVPTYKFLGVFIDDKLNFKVHIDSVCSRLSRVSGTLKRLNFLPVDILKKLYFSMVYPLLNYGLLIWGSTFKTYYHRIIILQKRIVRTVNHSCWYAHTTEIFKKLNLMKFSDLYFYFTNVYMFKTLKLSYNPYLLDNIEKSGIVHNYPIRSNFKIRLPFFKSSRCQRSLLYCIIKNWNTLPNSLLKIMTLGSFKINLQSFIVKNYD